MKNTLTSIAEHSDWLQSLHISDRKRWHLHRLRIEFGKQPLAIWQFVACKLVDGFWVPMEEPYEYKEYLQIGQQSIMAFGYNVYNQCNEFQEAKSRCIFEGWVLENTSKFTIWIEKDGLSICFTDRGKINVNSHNEKTIEDLVKYNPELTASAIKELGL